jgi:AcrR family transcriptional regulator
MAGVDDWLTAGLGLIRGGDPRRLTIDGLARELGLTKGSFYHHFTGMADYRRRLLGHYRDLYTTRYIDAVEDGTTADPIDRLHRLIDLVTSGKDNELGVAVRAWAMQDADARAVQEQIDAARLDYLRGLFGEQFGDRADTLAHVLYLVVIGSEHLLPPLDPRRLRAIAHELISPAATADR